MSKQARQYRQQTSEQSDSVEAFPEGGMEKQMAVSVVISEGALSRQLRRTMGAQGDGPESAYPLPTKCCMSDKKQNKS